jgi:uncharacterized protein (TIGR00725 family)
MDATTPREKVLLIGVIGSDEHPGEPISAHARRVAVDIGRRIAEHGAVLISGGGAGIMEAASEGAYRAGGVVIGLLPGRDRERANQYVTIPLSTGLGEIRSYLTVSVSDAIIMIAGSTGTLNEATIAYGQGKPLVVVTGTGGWSDRLPSTLYEGAHFDQRATATVKFASSSEEAAVLAFRLAGGEARRASEE